MNLRDTIVAVATPLARSGIGVVRLSGSESRDVAAGFLDLSVSWSPRHATMARLLSSQGDLIDQVVVTWFAAPHSYTAEDVVEISCHGSPVVLQHCLERAVACGARLAEPGEFTLRAFLHGRIDLPQAEAVRDLIESTTLYQAQVAARQVEGSVSRRVRPVKEQLLELIALLEAGIDFAEDDVSVASDEELFRRLKPIRDAVAGLAGSFERGRLVFTGATLAIAGRPNVGKSSLFNRLLEQDRAIVTEIPGTTRDTISESLFLRGIPIRLVDTAGIRLGSDQIEKLGIERSFQAIADADVTLLVLDGSQPLTEEDQQLLERLEDRKPIVIANKSDLPQAARAVGLPVSALTGSGIPELRDAMIARLAPGGLVQPEEGAVTSTRQVNLLRESLEALHHAERAIEYSIPHEMLLLDLYAALRPLDAVTGATTADDILNRIFSTFCIGK